MIEFNRIRSDQWRIQNPTLGGLNFFFLLLFLPYSFFFLVFTYA
jgi:hypothetical protein